MRRIAAGLFAAIAVLTLISTVAEAADGRLGYPPFPRNVLMQSARAVV